MRDAARAGRAARGAARRRLGRARHGRGRRAAGSSSTRTGPCARPRSGCRWRACRRAASRASMPTISREHPFNAAGVAVDGGLRPVDGGRPAGLRERAGGGRDPGRLRAVEGKVRRRHQPLDGLRRRGDRAGGERRGGGTMRRRLMDVLGPLLMRDSLDHCVKCTICETYCPVAQRHAAVPRARSTSGRRPSASARPTSRRPTTRWTTARAAGSARRSARRACTSRRSTRRRARGCASARASSCATGSSRARPRAAGSGRRSRRSPTRR